MNHESKLRALHWAQLPTRPIDRLEIRPDLSRPIDLSRSIRLTWLFDNLSRDQFGTVIVALRSGLIESSAFFGWLDLNLPFERTGREKTNLTDVEWQECRLRCPNSDDVGPEIHLIDNINERAFVGITLNTSHVNRALGLTGQSGGQPPKMGPRLYAWLTNYYAYSDLPADPVELFAIVIEIPELWENGEIDDARGVAAIANFLSSLEEFATRSWPPEYSDISIAGAGSHPGLEVSTRGNKGDFND